MITAEHRQTAKLAHSQIATRAGEYANLAVRALFRIIHSERRAHQAEVEFPLPRERELLARF